MARKKAKRMKIDELNERWGIFKNPWQVLTDIVNKVQVPVRIQDNDRCIIHDEYGLYYGASESTADRLNRTARAIAAAPWDIQVLCRALCIACAKDETKMDYVLQHAEKELLIEAGKLKDDLVAHP